MKKLLKSSPQSESEWAAVRARYEARDETVAAIAASITMKVTKLVHEAKVRGWALRSARKVVATTINPEPKPITSTKEAINRLKDLVQSRIARLEHAFASGTENERGINSANLLVRTLEKVLELEEQQRKHARLNVHENKRRDDTWRDELASRIARLGQEPQSGENLRHSGD